MRISSPAETTRSRFVKCLKGERPDDRLPMLEWATWWDLTLRRWRGEGLDSGLSGPELMEHFGLDVHLQHWFWGFDGQVRPLHTEPTIYIEGPDDYERLRPHLYNVWRSEAWASWAGRQASGDAIVWFTVNGFFWWPRVLFGIEGHLYAFYDHPELMHRINQDQTDYALRCIDAMGETLTPDFMTFAEDMSYNHGPMLSRELFDEFLAPYYRQIVPKLRERGIAVLVDSDGGVEPMLPWLIDCGIQGLLPLERMAGVDVARIRRNHPEFLMVGGYDKLVMSRGEDAMRAEFERLLPTMRAGRYVPSVDHQTPPEVSLDQYRIYLRLFAEYAALAAKD